MSQRFLSSFLLAEELQLQLQWQRRRLGMGYQVRNYKDRNCKVWNHKDRNCKVWNHKVQNYEVQNYVSSKLQSLKLLSFKKFGTLLKVPKFKMIFWWHKVAIRYHTWSLWTCWISSKIFVTAYSIKLWNFKLCIFELWNFKLDSNREKSRKKVDLGLEKFAQISCLGI